MSKIIKIKDDERTRESKQRLLKLDTYGFAYWMEKFFDWEEDYVICEKRNVKLNLEDCELRYSNQFGTVYLYNEFMIVVGNYEGTYVKKEFENLYRYYRKIK